MLVTPNASTQTVHFSVDSALLAELGERLVGRSHIALAELIKNSYDADAELVKVTFRGDTILVEDDGHGMTPEQFETLWMRIGTPHKQKERVSRGFGRPLTGAKGIGRLAVQFLGRKLRIETQSDERGARAIYADVDWNEAVQSGELTEAEARFVLSSPAPLFVGESSHGTKILISDLNQSWSAGDLKELAEEIWALRPPFLDPGTVDAQQPGFDVILETSDEDAQQSFENQMKAILDIWSARIRGEAVKSEVAGDIGRFRVLVELRDGTTEKREFEIENCELDRAKWEIRVYTLQGRLPRNIRVQEARDYFRRFGGVHIYDSDFHVPYYGVDTDWLGIEQDHAHRLSQSRLLPPELQVSRGLNDLPTNSRLFGVVRVDTVHERTIAEKEGKEHRGSHLSIQPSRDRLVNNQSYDNLKKAVRWSLDYYAMVYRGRQAEKAESLPSKRQVAETFERTEEVLEQYKDKIPTEAYQEIRSSIAVIERDREVERRATVDQVSLLSALASVGISSLAYQHELGRMYTELDSLAAELRRGYDKDTSRLPRVAERLERWIERSKSARALFSHMLEEENRQERRKFRVKALVEGIYQGMGSLTRGVQMDASHVDPDVRLPEGTYAEWTAVFQNVFSNATSALLDTPKDERYIALEASCEDRRCHLVIQDNGVGIDLKRAAAFFRPFERGLNLSPERQSLSTGGTGLGLTIVKTIAGNLGCKVSFVRPSGGFETAFRLDWET